MGTVRLQLNSPVHPHVRGDGKSGLPDRFWLHGSPPRAWGRRRSLAGRPPSLRFTPTCVGTALCWMVRASSWTVHPHVRGDGDVYQDIGFTNSGSPPRAWGRRIPSPRVLARCRFTPTCVGTATERAIDIATPPVHPHVRGDGETTLAVWSEFDGLPPRAWGRPEVLEHLAGKIRFTPTCVGTAASTASRRRNRPVHPHVRGDGSHRIATVVLPDGSPPRAWGRQPLVLIHLSGTRFTPTCVGTAWRRSYDPLVYPVHPHVRGDGASRNAQCIVTTGSPPRAWGRHQRFFTEYVANRFTPTCVGTALGRRDPPLGTPVHPHVRGDGARMRRLTITRDGSPPRAWGRRGPSVASPGGSGSPPRAWGRLGEHKCQQPQSRFTPTCVGTANHPPPLAPVAPVHPHVRGDGDVGAARAMLALGSPPRAWGRRRPDRAGLPSGRFTPTCVGTAAPWEPSAPTGPGSPPRAWGRRPGTCHSGCQRTVHPHVRGDGQRKAMAPGY